MAQDTFLEFFVGDGVILAPFVLLTPAVQDIRAVVWIIVPLKGSTRQSCFRVRFIFLVPTPLRSEPEAIWGSLATPTVTLNCVISHVLLLR